MRVACSARACPAVTWLVTFPRPRRRLGPSCDPHVERLVVFLKRQMSRAELASTSTSWAGAPGRAQSAVAAKRIPTCSSAPSSGQPMTTAPDLRHVSSAATNSSRTTPREWRGRSIALVEPTCDGDGIGRFAATQRHRQGRGCHRRSPCRRPEASSRWRFLVYPGHPEAPAQTMQGGPLPRPRCARRADDEPAVPATLGGGDCDARSDRVPPLRHEGPARRGSPGGRTPERTPSARRRRRARGRTPLVSGGSAWVTRCVTQQLRAADQETRM